MKATICDEFGKALVVEEIDIAVTRATRRSTTCSRKPDRSSAWSWSGEFWASGVES
jgi:hypothetical protein